MKGGPFGPPSETQVTAPLTDIALLYALRLHLVHLALLLHALAAHASEGGHEGVMGSSLLDDLTLAADDWRRPWRDRERGRVDRVRRRKHAAQPSAEDRGKESEDRAERERVAERIDVEVAQAGKDIRERTDARAREDTAVGETADEEDDQEDEEREERGHHPVPARAIARHTSGDVTTDDVAQEDAEDDRHGEREIGRALR